MLWRALFAEVEFPTRPQIFGQRFQGAPQRAVTHPVLEATVAGLIRREAVRQVLPLRAAAQNPEDAVEHLACITPRAAPPIGAASWFRNQGLDDRPLIVGQFFAPCHDPDRSTTAGHL
jgi:hypothetical protein